MTSSTHPDHNLEQQQLEKTLSAVQLELERKRLPSTAGVNDGVNIGLDVLNATQIPMLEQTLQEAYFARLDVVLTDKPRTIYIGKHDFRQGDVQIFSWRDGDVDGFSSLVYRKPEPNMSYRNGTKEIKVQLNLRRRIDLWTNKIKRITDEADFRAGKAEILDSDVLLRQRLESRDSLQPRDIISTIQSEQNELIRAPHNQAIIINGVAGSGKTMIAYHRLSVLLFERNNTGIRADKVLFIGPNRSFLEFMRGLLPSLDIAVIRQKTLSDYLLEPTGIKLPITDFMLEQFMSLSVAREAKKQYWLDAKLFGDLRWHWVLERYAKFLMQDLRLERNEIVFALPELGVTAQISLLERELRTWYAELRELPITHERRREALHERLSSTLKTRFETQAKADAVSLGNATRQAAFRRFDLETNRLLDRIYPQVKLSDYRALLENTALLEQFAPEFSVSEQEQIQQALPKNRNSLDILELAGVYLLFAYAGILIPENLDHIVIDEAQDLSPLQLNILARIAKGSITILGDIAQGIHGYRGLRSWDDAESAVATVSPKVTRANVLRSYRSTPAITRFNNEILRRVYKNAAVFAEVFERSDEAVQYQTLPNLEQMFEHAKQDIAKWQSQGKSIAVITRTHEQAQEITSNLKRYQIPTQLLEEGSVPQAKQVLVSSVALCKGLEFEAVVVLYADHINYQQVQYEGRLLYVACSRAMNHLSVYGVGKPSRYLHKTLS
jgi:DNA helicase II / ATP-dependent DNA helicase PcrA